MRRASQNLPLAPLLLLAVAAGPRALSQPIESRVNTYTTGKQWNPRVATDSSGRFVVVWQSATQDGSSDGVFGQRFASSGLPLGPEFRVSTYTTNMQNFPAVASDSSGDFVVAWQSNGDDGSGYGIFAQRYASSGASLGAAFRVNTYTFLSQGDPSVARAPGGDFLVVWQSFTQDGSFFGIHGQRFADAGAPLGGEFLVNTFTTGNQRDPFVSSDSSGGFVVVWSSYQDGSEHGVFGQRYASSGSLLGAEFQANGQTTGNQRYPSVACDPVGGFLVVWASDLQDGSLAGVYGRRFSSSGSPLDAEFRVNSYTTLNQLYPSLAFDTNGDFEVVWSGSGVLGYGFETFGRRFASSGAPAGPEAQLNAFTVGHQSRPSVARRSSGDFVVVWLSDVEDGSEYGVFGNFCTNLSSTTISVNGETTVCPTGTGGTVAVTDVGGGLDGHQWGYRLTSTSGMILMISGETGTSYVVDGSDFPGLGTYYLVCVTTPQCGSFLVSNEIPIAVSPDSSAPSVTSPAAVTTTQTLCM